MPVANTTTPLPPPATTTPPTSTSTPPTLIPARPLFPPIYRRSHLFCRSFGALSAPTTFGRGERIKERYSGACCRCCHWEVVKMEMGREYVGEWSRAVYNLQLTMGQINQEYRLEYWATRSSVRLFARTAHLFACFGLFASLAPSAALTRLLICSLPRSWDRED